MIKVKLQQFGGRGGAVGGGGGKAIAAGGAKGTIEIRDGRDGTKIIATQKFTTFSGNEGAVSSFAVGYGSEIVKGDYDVVVNLTGLTVNNTFFNSRSDSWDYGRKQGRGPEVAMVGIKLNTPKGVSEKQESYAKNTLARQVESASNRMLSGVPMNKVTMQEFADTLKALPYRSARDVLDRRR